MFKIATTHRFVRTVEVLLPSETVADTFEKQTFQATFEVMDPEATAAAQAEMALATSSAEMVAQETAQIVAVLKDWSDVDAEFSEEGVRAACRFPWFRRAVAEAYAAGISGGTARLGN